MRQKIKKNKRTKESKSQRGLSPKQKRTVAAIAIIVIGTLLLLSIVSYTPADETITDVSLFDLWKVFGGDPEIQAKADVAQNWLGLVGAIISQFVINSALGYSVIVIPLLIIVWGWYVLRNKETRRLIVLTNYTLIFIILSATMFGLVRLMSEEPMLIMNWSGLIGDYLARSMSKLLGMVGSSIVTLTLLISIIVFAIDLDLQRSIDRIRQVYARFIDGKNRKLKEWREKAAERKKERLSGRAEHEKEAVPSNGDTHRERTGSGREPIVVHRPEEEQLETSRKRNDEKNGARPKSIIQTADSEKPESRNTQADDDLELNIRENIEEEELDTRKAPKSYIATDDDEEIDYVFPSVDLLEKGSSSGSVNEEEVKTNAELLRGKLSDFGVEIESVGVTRGPVLTLYELVPAAGVKISKITSLSNDLALALQAKGIRILAPIPGKGAVGVEIPNHNPSIVTFRSVINSKRFHESTFMLPMAMGKTISGEIFVDDLARLPHLLIAGSTGSGKSVGINTIITSFLYRLHPSDIKFVIIDPKKIELTPYRKLDRHYLAVSPDIDEKIATNAQNAVTMLRGVEIEMEQRYDRLASAGVRNIQDYNKKIGSGQIKSTDSVKHKKLPYLIVIIDELADLMLTAARDVEDPIARLAQLARAVGIHLILATQRPSVDVITGVIKANFSARIAYQVAQKNDSRTILDMNGAEQLLGNGDMLYLPSGSPKPIRLQNSFLTTDEVERITTHIKKQPGFSKPYYLPSILEKKKTGYGGSTDTRDELFEEAAELVVRHQQGSVSLIQRRLKVGYSRAARIIDELEAAGIVGPFDGSKARQVLVETDSELNIILESLDQ
jgi:DNA segregation ATPase FtsK/SpoIIIE, S-DNA-T family